MELKAGEERTDLEVTIPTTGLHTVHGFVTSGATGAEVPSGTVKLMDVADKTILRDTFFRNGEFVLKNVPAGGYLLAVTAQAAGDAGAVRYAPVQMPVDVQSDLTDLRVTMPAETK